MISWSSSVVTLTLAPRVQSMVEEEDVVLAVVMAAAVVVTAAAAASAAAEGGGGVRKLWSGAGVDCGGWWW